MKFIFVATTGQGQRRRGVVEAPSRVEALRELKRRKLTPLSLSPERRGTEIVIPYVTPLEKVVLTKHLAIMLRAGITLSSALETLVLQSRGYLRGVLEALRDDVEAGERLADAMAAHPRVFSDYYINMVRAGEESGNLAENLEQLSLRFGKDYELRRKAQSAMFYPALVLTLTAALGLLISLFVLPRLSNLFQAFDFELPLSTRVLIAVSAFLAENGVAATIVLVAGVVAGVSLLRSRALRPATHRVYLRLPIVREVIRFVNLARLSMVLGSLLRSGIPINHAIPITANVLTNAAYKQALLRASDRVNTGEPLSTLLQQNLHLFPPFVYRMVLIGEQTGKLDEMLFYLAEFYETELDTVLKNVSTFIEPLLLVVIGLVVAFTALAIITPVYNFIGAIG
jgi:type II secretory pathway component PulF